MRFLLRDDQIPTAWYNALPDLPEPLQPPLHPGTREPVGPDDLAPLGSAPSRPSRISRREQARATPVGPRPADVERVRGQLRAVDAEAVKLEREIARRFHPYWGSLLKEANEQSSFGDQVEEYACLYTSRVSNFLYATPYAYFRSPRGTLPHDVAPTRPV